MNMPENVIKHTAEQNLSSWAYLLNSRRYPSIRLRTVPIHITVHKSYFLLSGLRRQEAEYPFFEMAHDIQQEQLLYRKS